MNKQEPQLQRAQKQESFSFGSRECDMEQRDIKRIKAAPQAAQ